MQNRTPDTERNNQSQKNPVPGSDIKRDMGRDDKRAESMDVDGDRKLQGRNNPGQGSQQQENRPKTDNQKDSEETQRRQ